MPESDSEIMSHRVADRLPLGCRDRSCQTVLGTAPNHAPVCTFPYSRGERAVRAVTGQCTLPGCLGACPPADSIRY